MEIVLSSISDKSDLNNERIGFNVLKDCNLKYFLIFKTKQTTEIFFNKSTNAYWFTPEEVKVGDKIVLYSKEGKKAVTVNKDGSKTYFFYLGLTEPIFRSEDDCIVLTSINEWTVIPKEMNKTELNKV